MSLTATIGLGALLGPSQVGARAVDSLASRRHPLWNTLGSALLVAVGLLLLLYLIGLQVSVLPLQAIRELFRNPHLTCEVGYTPSS